jgi:pimeloyl-ACP methyl ester carboxylesterase
MRRLLRTQSTVFVLAALVVVALALPALSASDALPRRAEFGLSLAGPADGKPVRVARVRPDTPASRAGIVAGDEVVRLNGIDGTDARALVAFRKLRAGDTLDLSLRRDGKAVPARLRAEPWRPESHDGLVVEYGAAPSARGYLVRTITTRPARANGRLPVLVFIPWLSCSPVELPPSPTDGWSLMMRDVVVRSGYAVVRVEKPGVADSGGPDCSETDLEDDLEAYRAGIRAALALDFVDPQRLYLFGGSIGASLVPMLALEFPVKGLVASGGFSRSWIEHILGFERRRLTLSGSKASKVNEDMKRFADFYSLYLNGGRTPAEVVAARPDLAGLWYDEPGHQFGRRAAYYQQVQKLDVEGAWPLVRVPTLLLWGSFDWIMGREDQDRIVAVVDPSLIRFVVRPGMNHHFEVFPDARAAFREEGGRYDAGAAAAIVDWLREQAGETREPWY